MAKSYSQLLTEIEDLKNKASKVRDAEVRVAIKKINDFIAQYQLTASDLALPGAKAATRAAKKSSAVKSQTMYHDGQGNSWSGRGPRPQWLRTALSAGQALESFLSSAVSTVAGSSTKAKPKPSDSSPKYADPKTGATWSGRGPRPRWLKAGMRKRGAKIEDFLVGAAKAIGEVASEAVEAVSLSKRSAAKKATKPTAKKVVSKLAKKVAPAKSAAKMPAAPKAKAVKVDEPVSVKPAQPKQPAKALKSSAAAKPKQAAPQAALTKAKVKSTPKAVSPKATPSKAAKKPAVKSLGAKVANAAIKRPNPSKKVTVKAAAAPVAPAAVTTPVPDVVSTASTAAA